MVKELNRNHRLVPFLFATSVTYFLSDANLLEKFTPRSWCMRLNGKLITLHWSTDTMIFLDCMGIGIILFLLYKALRKKGLPFTEFVWEFAGFTFFIGVNHAMQVLNLYVTYYWLDGAMKLLTAWFGALVFLALFRDFGKIKNLPTPREFDELKDKVDELIKKLEDKNNAAT